jgi:hypothetical protein
VALESLVMLLAFRREVDASTFMNLLALVCSPGCDNRLNYYRRAVVSNCAARKYAQSLSNCSENSEQRV